MNHTTGNCRANSWRSRIDGLVPASISEKQIAIVGCGSVGSFIGDELARSGVMNFTLVDPDTVEWPNITRTVYGSGDIGIEKVEALARHLKSIFPDIRCSNYACELQDFGDQLIETFERFDLVIAAVDDPKANGLLDRLCYALAIPTVFVGIYKGAKGGEVIAVSPPLTPCFGCATGGTRTALSDLVNYQDIQRNRDYGTNKLIAEIALGSDIHFVCNAAIKICLSIVAEKGEALHNFIYSQIEQGIHYLMLGTEPSYYIFPSTHKDAIGQHAFQSLWLKTTRRNDCPRCGDPAYRIPVNTA